MTKKRLFIMFAILIAGFMVLEARLFLIMVTDTQETASASSQSRYVASIAVQRPDFYDCNGKKITSAKNVQYAILYPKEQSSYTVLGYMDYADNDYFLENMGKNVPFAIPLKTAMPENGAVQTENIAVRYHESTLAKHLIGYLDYDGNGVFGLEAALNDYLSNNKQEIVLECEVNAQGAAIDHQNSVYIKNPTDAKVTLTIDSKIQKIAETVADETLKQGAIVVLETKTGELKAVVSRPDFNQNDIAAAIDANDTSLINRAFTPYNVGSVYKPILACCALNSGIGESFSHECTGTIAVNGQEYSCNNQTAHGYMDLKNALVHSCNTYFIALGQRLQSEAIYNTADALGIGKSINLCENFTVGSGNLPTVNELNTYGELCNHCFGQGKLMMTPLHIAAATNCIANNGIYIAPTILKQVGNETFDCGKSKEIFSENIANTVAEFLESVVEEGTGTNAKPSLTTAAGKTGTAQTGTYNEDGKERVIGWFTGWFPAKEPKYTVVVMTEDEGYGFESAAPIFAKIADYITANGY